LSQTEFAEATESLGASLSASVGTRVTEIDFNGLTSRFGATLDRLRDMALLPNLENEDFERERSLTLSAIEARADNPSSVARRVTSALLFGPEDPRGRPRSGELATVRSLTLADVRRASQRLLSPDNTSFVFVGDFGSGGAKALRAALEKRFGNWRLEPSVHPPKLVAKTQAGPRGIFFVDRPGAPQTVLRLTRPLESTEGMPRQARRCVNTAFGGSFTSRLNQNLREDKGYAYGAGSGVRETGEQTLFSVGSSVRTDVTGAALLEIRAEFERMHAGGLSPEELEKAQRTLRYSFVQSGETTSGLASTLAGLVQNGRPTSDLRESLAALAEVDRDAANRISSSDTFNFEDLTIVLVGDKQAILTQLREGGFPTPVEVDADGNPL